MLFSHRLVERSDRTMKRQNANGIKPSYLSTPSTRAILTAATTCLFLQACGGSSGTSNEVIDEPVTETPAPSPDPTPDPEPVSIAPQAPADATKWILVWNDEFDGDSINTDNWTHEINCDGGGNQEQQCYTDSADNSFVEEGFLNIVAMPAESGAVLPYTSARLNSRFKADFTYGRFEMRAKLPSGQGSWPAFWMLPTDYVYGGWPNSGEIDIMEAVNLKTVDSDGEEENRVFGTLHYGEDWPNNQFSGDEIEVPGDVNPADGFNVYAIEWQEGEIRWYLNDVLYATQLDSEVEYNEEGEAVSLVHPGWYVPLLNTSTGLEEITYEVAPFDQNFHMIMNLAVGGNFPENTNLGGIDASAFTDGQTFQIDWVRVFQCAEDTATGAGCESVSEGYLDETLVDGKAIPPSPLSDALTETFTVFDDTLSDGWSLFDCCGGTTPQLVEDDAQRGQVAEFEILNNNGTVLGFNSRDGGSSINASNFVTNGSLKFDLKIVSPTSSATTWIMKVEAANNTSAAELPLSSSLEGAEPVIGEWQTYTFSLQQLASIGLDISRIDLIMAFPAWQTGEGAVFRIDNVVIGPDEVSEEADPLVLFDDTVHPNWQLWDCCGGTAPVEVFESDERGSVAEFEILDNNGTVLGFYGRESGGTYNALGLIENGVLQFDMKVVSPPTASTSWLLKVESGSGTVFAELGLTDSLEGLAPADGEWQTYTFPLSTLASAGLDLTRIDIVMIFPAWQTGEGAVYRVDNVKIHEPI